MKHKNTEYLFRTGIIFFLLLFCPAAGAQDFVWKAGLHSFFDNAEFDRSQVQDGQTMAGVHLVPEAGLRWNKQHRIFAGADLMYEYGSGKILDFISPTAYYEFEGKYFRFYTGAFHRKKALENYPRMFFQDSTANYRPVMHGLFWEFHKKNNRANLWLDWTGRQTEERRETFFMGWSGRWGRGLFYAQHFGYMFHFARRKNPAVPENLHDNGLILTSVGMDFAPKTAFDKLELNAGWSAGLERNRSNGLAWQVPHGFLSEAKIEYKGLGLFNTFYKGGAQQIFYGEHGSQLYWGDRFYRTTAYNRTDLYINFFKTNAVNVRFNYSLHFAEQTMYHEQALYASFDVNSLKKQKEPAREYLWSGWFK